MIFRAIWDPHLYDPSMARPETPTTRARWDARRADVIERAAQVFARRGYDQTSVPELAEALEQATGGIYHYFSGKEQLLIAICDQLMEPLLSEAEELLASGAPASEQLLDLVRRWVANVIDHQDHMLVFQQERHLIDHGAQWREVRESRKRFERLVEDVLARAGAEGGGPAVDPRLQLSALLGMVNHTAQWYRPRGRLSPTEIADGYVALVLGC
jgi:TetR/AcrR family transcriptional regulator, cholesterol catabolism regulator